MVSDVAAPGLEDGTVLVRVHHSCISVGTELSGVRAAETPLWRKALNDPAKITRAARMVATQGLAQTRQVVNQTQSTPTPVGYSAAGVVLEVGTGVDNLAVGLRVACAGAGVANHAEVVRVPQNLCVVVPDSVPLADASTVTLGAIALQGVRRASPTLGETVAVVGLGLLGQLTVQLLKANGCRVVGIDLDQSRVGLALSMGADAGVAGEDGDLATRLAPVIGESAVDAVIVTAASPGDEVMATAFGICRKKGRVVLVGDVGLGLRRSDIYEKELDFLVSTSYGPGRYDRRYEDEGLDYPLGYVRWTENRNMAEVVRLLSTGQLSIAPLITTTFPVEEAPAAYRHIEHDRPRPLMVLLDYPAARAALAENATEADSALRRHIPNPRARPSRPGRLRVALVGAGSFARAVHVPNLLALDGKCSVRAIVSRSGHGAAALADQVGAAWSGTDPAEVLSDPDVDAVVIATRHHDHAALALAALEAGKHVLVEKPLALNRAELEKLVGFFGRQGSDDTASPVLLTGFNRRFSPLAQRLRQLLDEDDGPAVLDYRMNAGYLSSDHWVHGPQGGGRNIGEACHIYDLFTFLTGAEIREVTAVAARPGAGKYRSEDNFIATLAFADGSVASLTYTAMGSTDHPKERLDAFSGGKVITLDDYRDLAVTGAAGDRSPAKTTPAVLMRRAIGLRSPSVPRPGWESGPDKGHRRELAAFVQAALGQEPWPIPWWQQVQATEISFRVQDAITGSPSATQI